MERVIWVVDDEPVNADLIEAVFSSDTGIAIKKSANGRDFLQAVEMEGLPDLLVLDLLMPRMDGFAVLEALRGMREGRYFPVIVLSGLMDKESVVRALTLGADDYISKPFVAEEIRARVYNMLKLKERDELLNRSLDVLELNLADKLRVVEDTQKEVILRLGRTAEFRDDETGRHIERIADYVEVLARRMGIREEHALMMRDASPMHDVGKIGIPDSILLKPGPLTEKEFGIIKLHTVMGAAILGGTTLPLLEMAREISLSHHERWDGTGYPLRLKGAEIPLSGRIVAVADVFDALTSVRVYKAAWPIPDALAYIGDQRGRQFDPAVTDLFLAVSGEIAEIKKNKADRPSAKPMIRQVMDGDITIEELVEKWR